MGVSGINQNGNLTQTEIVHWDVGLLVYTLGWDLCATGFLNGLEQVVLALLPQQLPADVLALYLLF